MKQLNKMGLTLELQYDKEEDLNGIVDQLQTENVDHIGFTAVDRKREDGPFQQDAANVCDILAKILAKPNLKKITCLLDFDHDLDYDFPKNYDVKILELYGCDLTFWIMKKIMESTPNVEEIYIETEQDLTELPMIMQSLNGFKFKKLKSLQVEVDNFVEEEEPEEFETLSLEDKKLLAQQSIEIMKRVLPIEVKASVVEILDHDYLDDMDNDIDSPRNMLVLIKKEKDDEPKLIMMQRYGSELNLFGLDLVTPNQLHRFQVESASLTVQAVQAERHHSQVESASLTVHAVQAVVFPVIAVITIIALTIYSISSMF